jgi:hypothetical protein
VTADNLPQKGGQPPTPTPPGGPPAIPEVVTQFIAVTAKQNELREKEIEIQKYNAETERAKVSNAHEYSLKALTAQVEDRKDERGSEGKASRYAFWTIFILILGFIGITVFAMYTNKESVILEAVKLLAVGGGGGGIGYAVGARKRDSGSDP